MNDRTKKCKECKKTKLISEFSKHCNVKGGYRHQCKTCCSIYNKEWNRNNREYRSEYKKIKNQQPDRKAANAKVQRNYRKTNPKYNYVHNKVIEALRKGELIRQPCEVCGSQFVHAHHEDYDKPLNVMWLCPQHHRDQHASIDRF